MNQVTKYECKYCHELFNTEKECTECESKHFLPKQMISVYFNKTTKDGVFGITKFDNTYPYSIKIKMANDKEVKYIIDPAECKTKDSEQLGDIFDNLFNPHRKG